MLEKAWQKDAVAIRRDRRNRERDGWEYVGEGGGKLWELNRGCRIGYKITEVAIAKDGRGVWIKTSASLPSPPASRGEG